MSRFKVLSLRVIAALCMSFSCIALVGCSSDEDEEAAIEQAISAEFDKLKNLDAATVDEIAQSVGNDELTKMGIDAKDFAKAYLDGFDYSVQKVEVDGDKATATVTMTCKSLSEFQSPLTTLAAEYVGDSSNWEKSESQIYQELGTKIMDTLKSTPTATTQPITLHFTESGGEWTADENEDTQITNAMASL